LPGNKKQTIAKLENNSVIFSNPGSTNINKLLPQPKQQSAINKRVGGFDLDEKTMTMT